MNHENFSRNHTEEINWEYIRANDWPDVQHFKKWLVNIRKSRCLLLKTRQKKFTATWTHSRPKSELITKPSASCSFGKQCGDLFNPTRKLSRNCGKTARDSCLETAAKGIEWGTRLCGRAGRHRGHTGKDDGTAMGRDISAPSSGGRDTSHSCTGEGLLRVDSLPENAEGLEQIGIAERGPRSSGFSGTAPQNSGNSLRAGGPSAPTARGQHETAGSGARGKRSPLPTHSRPVHGFGPTLLLNKGQPGPSAPVSAINADFTLISPITWQTYPWAPTY